MEPPGCERYRQQEQHEHRRLPQKWRQRVFGICWFASEIRARSDLGGGLKFSCLFRAGNRGRISNLDLREEAIAAPGNGFHKAGTFGGVAEGLSDFVDRFLEPVVQVHEGVCWPELLL